MMPIVVNVFIFVEEKSFSLTHCCSKDLSCPVCEIVRKSWKREDVERAPLDFTLQKFIMISPEYEGKTFQKHV